MSNDDLTPPSRQDPKRHQRGEAKVSRIPIKVQPREPLRKPAWIRSQIPTGHEVQRIRQILRKRKLSSVCEEAACPNLGECFSHGTATFMIMGDICTRRCPFCDVAHGKPQPLNPLEPQQLAEAVDALQLNYVVITSVDRDDLSDGGAGHYAACVSAIRATSPQSHIEILVPDFRGCAEQALNALALSPPDIFNHNMETVPQLYPAIRPGASYQTSLTLLSAFKQQHPNLPTKSGLMLGLGETLDEVEAVLHDLRQHHCEMLTLGQYLQPSRDHLPVERYVTPDEFEMLKQMAEKMGFSRVASGPMVRSSYHADIQAKPLLQDDR
ncbi:MAG: lipoyl synthase [Candidatus Polarisedimenticolaceae bacterium]|nr:lipoyl synthase [Candidatus Polarisedimenticolaceae bacterium]